CVVVFDGYHSDLHSFPTRRSSDLGLEPVTSSLSGKRSNRLSYRPVRRPAKTTSGRSVVLSERDLQAAQQDRPEVVEERAERAQRDRKSTRLNSSHVKISYAVFCLK